MKKTALKRILAFVLCMTLSASLLPVHALAADGAEVEANALSMEGTNSVGNLLVNTLSTVEGDMTDTCRVTDIRITGKTADVKYQSDRAGELVVAVYEEDTMRMLGMGSTSVTAEDTMAAVEIDIDSMPEYFVAAAYLLDEVSHNPLCRQYVSNYYTAEFQAFLDTTVESYDSERVLNLDDDLTTNFVVFGEDTVLAEETAGVNIITDNGNGTYTIQNADERFLALQPGDSFAYTYNDGEVLVVVVASAEVSGTTVLVTEKADAELADVFEYVKIEVFGGGGDAEVDMSTADPGVVYEGPGAALDGGWYEPSYERTMTYSVNTSRGKAGIVGSVEFGFSMGARVYVANDWQYASMSLDYWAKISLALTAKIAEINLSLGSISEFVAPFIKFSLDIDLILEASVSLSWTLEYKGSFGFCYDSDEGFQNISEAPKTNSKVTFGGEAFFGLQVEAALSFLFKEIGNIALTGRAGIEAKATHVIWESQSEIQHDCDVCFDGDMYKVMKVSASVSFLDDLVKAEQKLAEFKVLYKDFYYCVDKNEFGWTTCPYIRYKVIVTVKDEDGNYRNGETILGTGLAEAPVTSGTGQAEFYLYKGNYTLSVEENTYSAEKNITVNKTTKRVSLTLVMAEEVAHGACGKTAGWVMYDNGFLLILGEGDMTDYSSSNPPPWNLYKSDIQKILVEDGIIRVGSYAFRECANLKEITFPESLMEIGAYAFADCTGLEEVSFPDELEIIETYAFSGCSGLTELTLPQSMIATGVYAFANCWGLEKLVICENTTDPNRQFIIGSSTFENCWRLESAELPTDRCYLAEYAFRDCSSLKSVVIPECENSVQPGVFSGCSALEEIELPEELLFIYESAFEGCAVSAIEIPESVVQIGSKAFARCPLTEIQLPEGLQSLGTEAFASCYQITEIIIPAGITEIRSGVFDGCSNLVSVALPEGLKSIGTRAFNSTALVEIDIPETVTAIDDYAFAGCYKLEKTVLPEGLTKLGGHAFQNTALQEITIPSGLTEIREWTFASSGLTEIVIPKNITSIGNGAFSCHLENICMEDGVKTIGAKAFRGSNITRLQLPDSVESIGDMAFYGCRSLTQIELPYGLKTIGEEAFAYNTALEEIVLPHSVESVGEGAFRECEMLTRASLSNRMTDLPDMLFYWCPRLTEIYIPVGIALSGTLNDYALFATDLKDVYFGGTQEQWAQSTLAEWTWFANATVYFNATGLADLALDGAAAALTENEGSVPEEPEVPETEADPTIPEMPDVTAEPEETEMPEETTEPVGEEEPAEVKEAEALPEEVLLPVEEILVPVSLGWNGNAPLATLLAAHRGSVSYDSGGFASVRLYGLVPGAEYFILLTENGSEDVLYVGQSTADEMGGLNLSCGLKRESYDVSSQAFGPSMDLTDGEILLWRDGEGEAVLLVNCWDELLLEGQDFELFITENGDGTAAVTAVGRGEYGGSVTAELYAVFYDPNGGESAPEGQVQLKGQSLALTAETPLHGEQSFAGWAEDAAAVVPDYLPGDTYDGPGGTLYAVWVTPGTDVYFDGVTDVRDAAQILRYVYELPSVFGTESDDVETARLAAADSDKDGAVTEKDAATALARLVS